MSDETTGTWIGAVEGFSLREPGPDADGPVLQAHGEEGMVAMEFADEEFVEGLTHLAAELQMLLDEQGGDA